jgi:hypothetical protein
MHRIAKTTATILLAAIALAPAPVTAQDAAGGLTVTPQFGSDVRTSDPLELRVDPPLAPSDGRLAVVIGHTDWSGLFERLDSGIVYRPTSVRLPEGDHEMVVYLVSPANEWRPVGRFRLRILPGERGSAGRQANVAPRVEIGNKGQVGSGVGPSTSPLPRDTFQDFTVNAGMQATVSRGAWSAASEINLLGVSNRAEAVRFGERQEGAPLVDLMDYRIGIRNHRIELALGHVSFGSHRHLFNGFASRGALATLRFGPNVDLALTALNGSSIVGWDNILGLEQRRHRVAGATLGIEIIGARPGALRLEASLLDGRLLPRTNFNEGAITDAEQSHGGGLRLVASDARQRFRLDGGYARSTFTNPTDPLLAQSLAIVPVGEETRDARYADVSYALLQEKPVGRTSATLVASYRHEQVDPLYGSVIADLQSDLLQNTVDLTGSLGAATAQVSYARARDNLDDIASIVSTSTRVLQVNAAVPLASVTGGGTGGSWWPSLVYGLNQVRQRGAGVPVNAGFNSVAQIADQVATDQALGIEWQWPVVRAGYRVNRSYQDNRQSGKDGSDLATLIQQVTLALTPGARLDLQVDLAFERALNKELARTDLTRRIGIGGSVRIARHTVLAGLVSTTFLEDQARTSSGRVADLSAELSQTVPFPRLGLFGPQGQFFVRYARQSARRLDRLFAIDDSQRLWTVHTGFNLSLF